MSPEIEVHADGGIQGEPDWDRCIEPGCTGARMPDQEACLAHVESGVFASALTRFKRGRPLDVRGVTIDAELAQRIVDAAPVDAAGRRKLSQARFDGATFADHLVLEEAVFQKDASFAGARFLGDVSFRGARIEGQACFSNAVFDGTASFDRVRFGGPAWFAWARFGRHAIFADATFGGPVWFLNSVFVSDASFERATFWRHTSFDQAAFGCHTLFAAVTFESDTEFEDTSFQRAPDFNSAAFRGRGAVPGAASLRRMKWSGQPLAGWGARARAALLDAIVVVLLLGGGLALGLYAERLDHHLMNRVLIVAGVVSALWFAVRNFLDQGDTGQTWGKRRVGVRVVMERDRQPPGRMLSLARGVIRVLDVVPLFLGLLWPLWDPKRQTFSDHLVGTVVVQVGDHWGGAAAEAEAEPQLAGFG